MNTADLVRVTAQQPGGFGFDGGDFPRHPVSAVPLKCSETRFRVLLPFSGTREGFVSAQPPREQDLSFEAGFHRAMMW